MTVALPWGHPDLQPASDPPTRRRYRRLQSWYRETHLRLPPGYDAREVLRGSMLPADAPADANFLDPVIAAYVEQRIAEVARERGTLDPNRLRRNMLSSMPLCFNLFGYLRARPDAAARALSRAFGLDIARITQVAVEWAPPPAEHLHDRTAFDAFVAYERADGASGFVGVETKYTEPFSSDRHLPAAGRERYRALTSDLSGTVFRPGAEERLATPATSQLWRNALLALSLRTRAPYAEGYVAVVALEGDPTAAKAVDGLRAELLAPDTLIRAVSLQALLAVCAKEAELTDWAQRFQTRYLDLSPIDQVKRAGRR